MNSEIEIPVNNLNELPALAKMVIDFAGTSRHFLFYGPMGAGKTTFIKELCCVLGTVDNLSSPTYSIINEYAYANGKIFHFDLYRLKDAEELLDIGVEDYLASEHFCFFEWPEMAETLVNRNHIKIEINPEANNRYIRITKFK